MQPQLTFSPALTHLSYWDKLFSTAVPVEKGCQVREASRQAGRNAGKQADRKAGRQEGRQTGRQAGRQAGRR